MEIFYEVRNLLLERANRALVFGRFHDVLSSEVGKYLWICDVPAVEIAAPGEDCDCWGSMRVTDNHVDLTQLLTSLQATSSVFPDAEIHLRADDCPGWVLDGKVEIVSNGKFQRYAKQFAGLFETHKPEVISWDFLIDLRIWMAVVQKHPDMSESQILTTRLSRAVAFTRSAKLKGPFLGFPIEHSAMTRQKKELKIPRALGDKALAACEELKITRQELTERGIYAGLLK